MGNAPSLLSFHDASKINNIGNITFMLTCRRKHVETSARGDKRNTDITILNMSSISQSSFSIRNEIYLFGMCNALLSLMIPIIY